MAAALAWQLRIPATSLPWAASTANASSLFPPTDFFIDILPTLILFAVGISLVVAPLTTALMNSIPVANAGLGSAINNAVSRVGQPLVTAILFIAISTAFYGAITTSIPRLDLTSPDVRHEVPPLNPPSDSPNLTAAELASTKQASTDAYHLAMLVGTGLLIGGAAVNAFGIRRSVSGTGSQRAADPGAAPAG